MPEYSALFSGSALWITGAIDLTILIIALWLLPWQALLAEKRLQHLMFGATVVMMLLWLMRAGISAGLSVHFLGLTTLTLMFGWQLALIGGVAAMAGLTSIGVEHLNDLPVNVLCLVIVPVLVSQGVLKLVERALPRNFFVYLFCCAFLGAGVASASGGLAMGFSLWAGDVYSWEKIYLEYIRLLPLIMFPEGLINGIIMTGMMVFYPDWIRSFDARIYIDKQ